MTSRPLYDQRINRIQPKRRPSFSRKIGIFLLTVTGQVSDLERTGVAEYNDKKMFK